MRRDFSAESKGNLKLLINSISQHESNFSGSTSAAGVDISDAVNSVSSYHRGVLEKNNTTMNMIDSIFSNVASVDRQYKTRMNSHYTELMNCCIYLKDLASIMGNSTNIHSSNFDGSNIKLHMSPGLTKLYLGRMSEVTFDKNGNVVIEYNQEYLKRIMQGNAEDVPDELYDALISTFTDMDMGNKEWFIENSYIKTVGQDGYTEWHIGSVFSAMAVLYQDEVNNMAVSFEEMMDPNNDIHKKVFSSTLLMQTMLLMNGFGVDEADGKLDVMLENIPGQEECNRAEYDYRLRFKYSGSQLYDMPYYQDLARVDVFQFRENIAGLLNDTNARTAQTFKVDVGNELCTQGINFALGKLFDVTGISAITGALSEGKSALETILGASKTNQSVENIMKNIQKGEESRAFYMGAFICVTSDGAFSVNKMAIDQNCLNMALRAFANREGEVGADGLGIDADVIEQAIKDNTLDELYRALTPKDSDYSRLTECTDWFNNKSDEQGEGAAERKYRSSLVGAYEQYSKDCGLSFSAVEINEYINQLSYEEMKMLEEEYGQFF